MKKRVLAILLASMLSISMVACSKDVKEASDIKWSEYVTLVDYTSLEKPTDEQVQEQIQSVLTNNGTLQEVTGRAVQEGDTVNIDYEGKKDGVAFEGGTAQGFDLKIGSNKFIDGFEDGLIGANIGETKELNLTFPESYHNADLAGKAVVFTVKINSIKESKPAELNDEFVQSVSQTAKTVDEYKEEVKKNLELTLDWQNILDNSQVEYPKGYLEQQEKEIKESHEKTAKDNDLSLEDYASQYGYTLEQFEEQIAMQAESSAKQTAIVRAICEKEGIKISDEEYKEKAQEYAEQAGLEDIKELEKEYSRDYIEEVIMFEKVQDVLLK